MVRARLTRPAREVAVVVTLYGGYTLVRNLLGDDRSLALRNGNRIIDLERRLRIFREGDIQRALDHGWLMQTLNTFYGIAHFVVTAAVLIWLYHRRASYSTWRTALTATTFLALIGFALFPLMPPRLVPGSGILDSLAAYGSPWNYEHGAVSQISNQFAAMPSLHVAWALWCSTALWVEGRHSRTPTWVFRTAAVVYASSTILTVLATGNHFVLDALGGAIVLLAGFAISLAIARRQERRRGAAGAPSGSEAVVAAVDRDDVAGVVAAGATGEVHSEAAEIIG